MQDERERLRKAGFSDQEIDAHLGKAASQPVAQQEAPASAVPTQRIRSALQGATLGLQDEAFAAVRSLLPGQTYESAIEDERRKLAAYREDRPMEALAYEVGGGLATGLAGGARAVAASAGRAGLREALKAGTRAATTSAVGQGVVSGAAGAEGSILTEQGLKNRLKGAAVGGGLAAALPFGVAKLGKLPGVRDVVEGAGGLYDMARRGVTNATEGTPLQSLGRIIEPTDITRIQREATDELPGSVTGPTVATMDSGVAAAKTAKNQATVAAEQGRLRAQQATAARRQVEDDARATISQVKQEESTLGALTKQRAGAVKEQGRTRADRLAAAAKEAEGQAKAIERQATADLRQNAAATREQAKLAGQEMLEQIREEAGLAVGAMRGLQPRGTAKRLQKAVRDRQTSQAEEHYEVVRSFGAPSEPDPEVYAEIFANPALRSAFEESVDAIRKGTRNATPGAPIRTPLRTININGVNTPELTLEAIDEMRRRVLAPQMRKGPDVVGLSRSQKSEALDTINRLEERYLAGFGSNDAADALRTARSTYRKEFQTLEALQDGLNLGSAKAGKTSGLLTQSRKELDEVVKRVEAMTPEQQGAFRAGAREWFDRVVQESPGDALQIAKKFSSEASQRRLALAYGDDAVQLLRDFAPDVVGKRTAAAAAQVRQQGAQLAQDIADRASQSAAPLRDRAQRAAALAERAQAEKAARAEQILAQRQADANKRIADTQRSVQSQVGAARSQAAAAQSDAAQLAQDLTNARVGVAQARSLPFADLNRALGKSTQQQTFVQRLLPQLNQAQRAQAVDVLGSNIQRELQDMVRAGKTPEEIMQRIQQLEQNDAVRALLAPQMAAFARQLSPTMGTRLPQVFRPAVSGAIGRRLGANYNE